MRPSWVFNHLVVGLCPREEEEEEVVEKGKGPIMSLGL